MSFFYEHPHFLIFTTRSGARHLFDAATLTVHPLYWPLSGKQFAEIYETDTEGLRSIVKKYGVSSSFYDYIIKWRRTANTFGAHQRNYRSCIKGRINGHDSLHARPPSWTPSPSTLSNLILVLTKDCNLRCSYCIYSGLYRGFSPLRKSYMTLEIAKKAIDHFFSLNEADYFRSIPDRKLDISFYGGEPLLCSDLLKKVVRHARSRNSSHYEVYFSMTTNLTYLPNDVAKFLIDNNIGVLCSLDGPASEHNRYRRFLSGKGTFDVVWRNIKKLRSLNKDYFNNHVRALVTINGNSNLEAVFHFFDDSGTDAPKIAFVNILRDLSTGEFHKLHPFDPKRYRRLHNRIWDEYFNRKRNKVPVLEGSFLYHYIEESLIGTYGRIMKFGDFCQSHYTGTCQPGRRLTVSVDGNFHICERISEEFRIGNAKEGLNLDKCNQIMRRYCESLPSCDRCWARGICHLCFAHVGCDGQFLFHKSNCNFARAVALDKLANLYSLLEEMPDALFFGDPLIDRYVLLEVR